MKLSEITFDDLLETSAKELQAFKTTLNLAIAKKSEREKLELKEKLEALASESGYTLEELTKIKTKKKSLSPALYQNPDDKTQTWSGKGRKPNWLLTQLEAGKSVEDFKIK